MNVQLNMKIVLAGVEATHKLGVYLGKSLDAPTIILLEGDLGVGKTSLVQGIGKGLGITESIVSPTFTLINEYTEGRIPLYHLDLYRLSSSEVVQLNLETYWEGIDTTPGIVAIEWSERMPYKPHDYINLCFTHAHKGVRQVEIAVCNCALPQALLDFTQNYAHESK